MNRYSFIKRIYNGEDLSINPTRDIVSVSNQMEKELIKLSHTFKGKYVGLTIFSNGSLDTLFVHTKENDINYYTEASLGSPETAVRYDSCYIDLGRNDYEHEKSSRQSCFGVRLPRLSKIDLLMKADKTPLFMTRVDDSGQEVLIGYQGITFEEYEEYMSNEIRIRVDLEEKLTSAVLKYLYVNFHTQKMVEEYIKERIPLTIRLDKIVAELEKPVVFYIHELVESGLLESNLINPDTKEFFTSKDNIEVSLDVFGEMEFVLPFSRTEELPPTLNIFPHWMEHATKCFRYFQERHVLPFVEETKFDLKNNTKSFKKLN